MRRRGLNIRKGLLRTIMPALRLLPPRAATRLVAAIGRVEYALLPGLRGHYDRAVARAGDDLGGRWDVAAVGRALAGNQIRWRARDLLLDGLDDRRVAPLFDVVGRDALDAALAEGRGVILLGNHFGAHLMPAHWLVRQGYPLRLFMERPRHVSRFLTRSFETDGPLGQRKLFISRRATPAEAAGSILRAARILKAGLIVNLAGDVRWAGPHTTPAVFLGRPYTFSSTWVALAAMSGAPVVPVFCRMEPSGAYRLEFLPPYHVPTGAAESPRACRWVQQALDVIADHVRRDPTNSNDYFFWPDSAANAA
jgi:KDO2-lipid IV(A) lauroyltransferase